MGERNDAIISIMYIEISACLPSRWGFATSRVSTIFHGHRVSVSSKNVFPPESAVSRGKTLNYINVNIGKWVVDILS